MPTITTESRLSANLQALGDRNAELSGLLRARPATGRVEFVETPQEVLAGIVDGRQLCSRHRPLDEASRLVDGVDLVENAVVVVHGFGMGWHVRELATRLRKAGLIIVFEPDLDLLRSVLERIDHAAWMRDALVLVLTDTDDPALLSRKLQGAESILAQGLTFVDGPAARQRLGEQGNRFATLVSDTIATAKTTLMTTLMRSVDTVRNLLLNIDHYALGAGVEDLADTACGRPAIVVSAGPSLARNIHVLRDRAAREHCVIIAVQTALKPLLAAGVTPHFVTALDYHEISRRFYEDLPAGDLQEVTLVADPKAHPVILDAFPGSVRCCANDFLDQILGPLARPMGRLPGGATVAHLAVYLARHLGCDPVGLIGQDLGFSEGLYYTPGTAIHEVWAPELNAFNTIAMMEWQRIVRHRAHLEQTTDIHGRAIYSDAQMVNYLQQFERDFATYAEEGGTIIDATEGGVPIRHTTLMPLGDMLDQFATAAIPPLPMPAVSGVPDRLKAVRGRLADLRRDVSVIADTSRKTTEIIRRMLEHQRDSAKMQRYFKKIEHHRATIEQRMDAFDLLNQLNQLGVFKRMKADRRIHLQTDQEPLQRQQNQLERDLENVIWTTDAAVEMVDQLTRADRIMNGETVCARPRATPASEIDDVDDARSSGQQADVAARICALVPVDPDRSGLGIGRSLAEPFDDRPVIQATLERLGQCHGIESIILICPRDFDVETLLTAQRIDTPIEIERCEGSPFPAEQTAIGAARRISSRCWRGGVAGLSVYDEVLCPQIMHDIMTRREISAALLVAPDWPLLDTSSDTGCDAIIERHREHPEHLPLVFTQAPPGLCGCVISASFMAELAERTRLATIGAVLIYQPHRPQSDPISRDVNIQIDHRTRNTLVRASFDTPRNRAVLCHARAGSSDWNTLAPAEVVQRLERAEQDIEHALPEELIIELTTERVSSGRLTPAVAASVSRPAMTREIAEQIFDEMRESSSWNATFAGLGDPLCHESFDAIIRAARDAGAASIHVRTSMQTDRAVLDRLLGSGADIVSIDLHADRAETYEVMHGVDRFRDVLLDIQYLIDHRRPLTGSANAAAIALPWIVPRLQRRTETLADQESFFDRWQHVLGTAVLESPPPLDASDDTLLAALDPPPVMFGKLMRRMVILADGTVPYSEMDVAGTDCAGQVTAQPVQDLWRDVRAWRRNVRDVQGLDVESLRTWQP